MAAYEKNINYIVENQFPDLFRTEGPVFVEFVRQYFKWLEGFQPIAHANLTGNVIVSAQNTTVTGTKTKFANTFSVGDVIAIYKDDRAYDLFTISNVNSNTSLTINTSPAFSNASTKIANTVDYYNPVYHLRRTDVYRDIDETPDQMIKMFKEKYLKDIQFNTASNKRLMIKHALDLYRSKGSERSVDLLFRLLFGVGAFVYTPSKDIFSTSSGRWTIPKYLELSPLPYNKKLVGKQVYGFKSGATAFADECVRRTVNGVFLDVLYITNIKGTFEAGELIDSVDNVLLQNKERTYLLGSLNSLEIDISGSGSGFTNGQIVSLRSFSGQGRGGLGRVANTTTIDGIVSFNLLDGGFGYTVNSEVIISSKVLELANVNIDSDLDFRSFFDRFETIKQPMAEIAYVDANNTLAVGDVLNTYYANSSLAGRGRIISLSANANSGTMLVAETVRSLKPPAEANANLTGNVAFWSNSSVVIGRKPSANLTGTVFPSIRSYNLNGTGTLFDTELITVFSNIAGDLSVNGTVVTTNNANLGVFSANGYITIHSNSSYYETRYINSVTNAQHLTVTHAFSFANDTANAAVAVAEPYITVFTRTNRPEIRQINAISNSTLLTVTRKFDRVNTASAFSATETSGTQFITQNANQAGTVAILAGDKAVTGTGTDFTTMSAGDSVVLTINSTASVFNKINAVTNATYLTLVDYPLFTNASTKIANTSQNTAIIYGKMLTFHVNSSATESHIINTVTNNSYLTIQSVFDTSNSVANFANSTVDYNVYTTSNAVVFTTNVYTDRSATGNVTGLGYTQIRLNLINVSTSNLETGQTVFQYDGNAAVRGFGTVNSVTFQGTNAAVDIINVYGRFNNSDLVYDMSNTFSGNLRSVVLYVGVHDTNGTFNTATNNFIKSLTTNTQATLVSVSQGIQANMAFSNDFLYSEFLDMTNAHVIDFLNVGLEDESYGFDNASINLTNGTIDEALNFQNIEFGRISSIYTTNPGQDYSRAPVVTIYEPRSASLQERDSILYLSNVSGDFLIGEELSQEATSGRALVSQFNIVEIGDLPNTVPNTATHILKVKRLRVYDASYFTGTTNSTTMLLGLDTSTTANIDWVDDNPLTEYIGLNAEVKANVIVANGTATVIEVVDSGFGFINNETIIFANGDSTGTAVANVASHGKAKGFYQDRKGFLSSDKKLFDGYYYQHFSYEIQSPLNIDKYEDVVRKITHVAGTKMFGSYVSSQVEKVEVNGLFTLETE